RGLVPARREPGDADLAAEAVDLLVVPLGELEGALEVAVGLAERALPRLGELLRGVDHVHRALLELDRVAICRRRDVDQLLRKPEVAIVVDADLGDDVTRLSVADGTLADGHRGHAFPFLGGRFARVEKHGSRGGVPSPAPRGGGVDRGRPWSSPRCACAWRRAHAAPRADRFGPGRRSKRLAIV